MLNFFPPSGATAQNSLASHLTNFTLVQFLWYKKRTKIRKSTEARNTKHLLCLEQLLFMKKDKKNPAKNTT